MTHLFIWFVILDFELIFSNDYCSVRIHWVCVVEVSLLNLHGDAWGFSGPLQSLHSSSRILAFYTFLIPRPALSRPRVMYSLLLWTVKLLGSWRLLSEPECLLRHCSISSYTSLHYLRIFGFIFLSFKDFYACQKIPIIYPGFPSVRYKREYLFIITLSLSFFQKFKTSFYFKLL